MSEAAALLARGDLPALRALFAGRVRAEPSVAGHRLDLADILIVQGELERADAQLELAIMQDAALGVPVALTRQLVRAAVARADCFERRRPPELVVEADASLTVALARPAGVESTASAPNLTGTVDGRAFTDLRDADDRTAEVLEVLTSTGKYVWVSLAQIVSLSIHPPERVRDIVWRQAELEVRGGPSGIVYLPAVYASPDPDDAQRLGRETDWREQGDETWGVGLRTFLIGDDALSINDFADLRVEA